MIDRSLSARATTAHTNAARRRGIAWRSAILVLLLASTWLIVGASLTETTPAVVSAGRTVFTVAGLFALSWWSVHRTGSGRPPALPVTQSVRARYRWWQLLLLALSGVSAYTVCSTLAIGFAGPILPALVMALTPAAVLFAEAVLSRTAPSLPTTAGTLLAIGGALCYVIPRFDGALGDAALLGTLLALVAMGSMAFYVVYFTRVNQGYDGPMAPRILPIFALGSVPLVLWAGIAIAAGDTVSAGPVGMLVVLGTVVYVPAYLLQHRILLLAGASYTALLGLIVPPIVGIGSSLLQLAAVPTSLQLVGMVVTVVGMVLVVRRRRTRMTGSTRELSPRGDPSRETP